MNYNQNMKIAQVTEKTLVVGVDIAKETQYARAFNYRGQEIYTSRKVLSFSNRTEGFGAFQEWIQELMDSYDMDSVLVGMEPTGHYWFNLHQYCKDHAIKVVLVNPYHVKRTKELDDNSPTKNDRKDPKTIAKLVVDGRYVEPYVPEGNYADLREIMKTYEHVTGCLQVVSNKIKAWLDQYFPEFSEVFKDVEGKTAMVTLRVFPLPENIENLSAEEILAGWKKEVPRGIGIKRARHLVAAAKSSAGCREGTKMALMALKMLLEEYSMYQQQITTILTEMTKALEQISYAKKLMDIKGLGMVTVAGIVAEIGDVSRFDDAKQIIKYAGLNLVENSSGKHKGITRISKRGRKRLRAILFRAILPMVSKNAEFKELHRYYTTRKENPLKKKQSLILLCCKLLRVMFAMMTKNVEYNGDKLIKDIRRPTEIAA